MGIELSDRVESLTVLTELERLIRLDDLWTEALRHPIDDRQAIIAIGTEMKLSLQGAKEHRAFVDRLVQTHRAEVETALRLVLTVLPISVTDRAHRTEAAGLDRLLHHHGDFNEMMDREIVELDAKLKVLRAGTPTAGDISKGGRCAIVAALAIAAACCGQWWSAAGFIAGTLDC